MTTKEEWDVTGTPTETEKERAKRHRKRATFDRVAALYDRARAAYPDSVVQEMIEIAGVQPGSRVLEVGCGTGQLTRSLVAYNLELTAIDPAPAAVGVARRNVGESVEWQVTTFEDHMCREHTLDLIVSAGAFHWVDPDVGATKPARLLRPGGWLAILAIGERYDEPFASALMDLWVEHSDDGGAWRYRTSPTIGDWLSASGLYAEPLERRLVERAVMEPAAVMDLEQTRATTISYDDPTRSSFLDKLDKLLDAMDAVPLERHTTLSMRSVLE